MSTEHEVILRKAAQIRLLILDIDGVLTDGRLYFGNSGDEYKAFHIRDGLGIRMLQNNKIEVAVISGRRSAAAERRLQDLDVHHVYLGVTDKLAVFRELLAELALAPSEAAFVGDDLVDLPVLERVGLAIAVRDADAFVRRQVHWQTSHPGGHGAVREVCELLLAARGLLDAERAKYLTASG